MKMIRVIKAKEINKGNLKAVIDAAKTLAYDLPQAFGFLQIMGINDLKDKQWLGENNVYEPHKIEKLIEKVIKENPEKAIKKLGPVFQKIYTGKLKYENNKWIEANLSDKELQKIHEEYRFNDLLLGLDKNNKLVFKAMDSGWKIRLPGNSFNTQKEAYEWYKTNYNKIVEWLDKDSERDHTLFSRI